MEDMVIHAVYFTFQWVVEKESFQVHVWMSHVTYDVTFKCVMSLWCHVWMYHVTYESVMSHENESGHVWIRHVTYRFQAEVSKLKPIVSRIWNATCESLLIWMKHARGNNLGTKSIYHIDKGSTHINSGTKSIYHIHKGSTHIMDNTLQTQ